MGGGNIFSQYLIIISALSYILWGWLFPLEWVWFAEYGTVCSRCACIYRHMNILAAELWLFSESKCYWSPGVYRKCILLLYCTHYNNISSTVIPGKVCPRKDWEQKVNIEGVFFFWCKKGSLFVWEESIRYTSSQGSVLDLVLAHNATQVKMRGQVCLFVLL